MVNTTGNLLALVDEVLEMDESRSGGRVLKEEDFNLVTMVQEVVDSYKPDIGKNRQKIVLDMATVRHSYVYSDKGALEQILGNLLSNASSRSPEGTELSVTVMELPKMRTGYAHYSFAVQDKGVRIPADRLEHIFEPVRHDGDVSIAGESYEEGGLAVAKELVDLFRGDIYVNSVMDGETCFTVTLGLIIREDGAFNRKDRFNLAGMKVLLVVDNAVNFRILRKFLVTEQISVEAVMNGQEAVSAFAVKDKGYYDVILMDMQMPIMNGYSATRQIRAMVDHGGADVPIIAVTSDELAEDIQMAMKAGMNGHLKKPVNFEEMREMLASIRK